MDNPLLLPSLVSVTLVAFTKQPEQILTTCFFVNINLTQLKHSNMGTMLVFSYWSHQNCWIVRSQSVGRIFNPYHTVGLHTIIIPIVTACSYSFCLSKICLLTSTISGRNSLPTISKMNNANSRKWPIIVLLLLLFLLIIIIIVTTVVIVVIMSFIICHVFSSLTMFHHHSWCISRSQVSPNARRRAQCRGGGGKGKYRYTRNSTTYRRLSENVVATFSHGTEIQETWKQSIPSGRISRNNFPIAQSFVPAKHFQFNVPSLLRASTGRMCWKWLPRKCSPHPTFGR